VQKLNCISGDVSTMLVTLKRTSSVKKECENNVKDYSTSWIWIAGTAFNSPGSSLLTGLLH